MLDQLAKELQRAKDAYTGVLASIDKRLGTVLTREPEQLEACQAFQQGYAVDYTPRELVLPAQPVTEDTAAALEAPAANQEGSAE